MADEVTEEEKKKGNPMMIILIVLIVLLIGAVGAIGYFLYSKGMLDDKNEDGSQKTEQKVQKAQAEEEGETFIAKIESLVLNITNAKGREKLMKLSFSLKSTEPTIATIIETNNAEIVDAVIAQISARTSEELLTVGGKALLKEEMLEEINAIINEATSGNEEIKRNIVKKIIFYIFCYKIGELEVYDFNCKKQKL